MATTEPQVEAARQQLLSDLHSVARRVERRLRYQAWLSWLIAFSAVCAGLLIIDCALQREEVGLRWLSWIVLLATSVFAAYRWLRPVLQLRVLPLDIAQWVESRQPQWSGRISTALQLAEIGHDDNRFGSHKMRDAALAQWQALPSKPRWEEVISNHSLQKSLGVLAAIVGSVFLLIAVWPELGVHALRRLFVPWSNERWPRADQLELANLPSAVGYDSVIQLEVKDRRPPLPEDVTIELRYPERADSSVVTIPTQRVADLAVASLPPILQQIQVRAVGGDDRQMPWQTIRVVEVPGWNRYKFLIQPPPYIRQSASAMQRLTTSTIDRDSTYELVGQRISVLAGSYVRFEGELAAPVREVTMQPLLAMTAEGAGPGNSSSQPTAAIPWRLQLDSDQISVNSVALANESSPPAENSPQDVPTGFTPIHRSVAWAVRMKTLEEVLLESPSHWKIEVLPDNSPEVVFESPPLKSLTLGAPLLLRAVARDDWGLLSMAAKLTLSSAAEVEYELPIEVMPADTREQIVRQEWDFASQLASQGVQLKPLEQISIWIEATDLSGKTSKSNVERIQLESKQRQIESIAGRQNLLSAQLAELISAQESAQELARRTVQDWQSKATNQQHLDAINSVNQLQQMIRQQLIDSPRSLQAELDRLRQMIAENQLEDTQLAQQLGQLREQVLEIGNGPATQAWKSSSELQAELAKSLGSADKSKLSSLADALDLQQTQTQTQLRELVSQLDENESINQLRESLLEIAQRQERVTVDTNQLNVDSLRDRPQDFLERLASVSSVQTELTVKMEQWLSQVLQLQDQPQPEVVQPLVQQLQEAAGVLVEAQVVDLMRASSNSLKSEQLGPVVQSQKEVQRAIEDALSKFNKEESSELLDSLTTQEQRLRMLSDRAQQLAQQQMQLAQSLSETEALASAQSLAESQSKVGQSTAQLVEEVEEDLIRETIRQAQQLQQQAAEAAANKSMEEAAELAEAAAKKLDEVAEQLAQKAEQANLQVMLQQMYELASALEQMVIDQQAIMPVYQRLAQQQQDSELAADFVLQSRALVQQQAAVRDSLRKLLPTTVQLQVFHWVLQQADSDLTRAVAATERNRLNPEAIDAADAGLRKMKLAIESLISNSSDSDPPEAENQDNPPKNDQQSNSEMSMPPLASLKLIRALQLELKDQTASLQDDANRRARIQELMRQQQELGELLEQLVAEAQTQQEQQ